VSNNGRWLVSGGPDGLSVWQPESGELVHHIPQFESDVAAVAIAPQSDLFISSDPVGNVSVWTLSSGERRYQVSNNTAVSSISIAPDGQSFVTVSNRNATQQWDIETGRLQLTLAGQKAVETVMTSPDGKMQVRRDQNSLTLWNEAEQQAISTIDEQWSAQSEIALDTTSSVLVIKSSENTVKVWQADRRNL